MKNGHALGRRVRAGLGIVLVALLASAAVVTYAFARPNAPLGHEYLLLIYDSDESDLASVSAHLARVNGGYLPDRFDAHLSSILDDETASTIEKDNILGFYAAQAGYSGSRAGERIFQSGERFTDDIVRIGQSSSSRQKKLECLYLLEGIRRGKGLYKPGVWVTLDAGGATLDHVLGVYNSGQDPSSHWSDPS